MLEMRTRLFKKIKSDLQSPASSLQNEHGDTLIEVILATIIIGTILFSAYTLVNKAFQLGQSARERSQAAQLLQQQAEGLRSLRDRAASFNNFRDNLAGQVGDLDEFHLERQSNKWDPASGGDWDPSAVDTELPSGLYEITIDADFVGPSEATPFSQTDLMKATIAINWQRLGGGPDETSTLYLHLTDTDLPKLTAN